MPNIKSKYQNIIVISIKVLSIIIIFITVNSDIDSKGFYTFLRVFIFISSSFAGYLAYVRDDKKGIIFFSIIAVLFNPIIPIYGFTKDVWILIDVFTVGAFIYSIINYLWYINKPLIKATSLKKDENLPQSSTNSLYAQKYFELGSKMERNANNSSSYGSSRLETALILFRDSIKCNPNLIDSYLNIGYITLQLQHN